jgi:hypothetical protein
MLQKEIPWENGLSPPRQTGDLPVFEQFIPVIVKAIGIGKGLGHGCFGTLGIMVKEDDLVLPLILFEQINLTLVYAHRISFVVNTRLDYLEFYS